MQTGTRVLLTVFVVFTLLAVNQLLVLGDHTDRFFAWTIMSVPNRAFVGAAYAAGTVLSVLAFCQARWSHVRVPVLTVTLFTVLTLVRPGLHRHRMHLMWTTSRDGRPGLARDLHRGPVAGRWSPPPVRSTRRHPSRSCAHAAALVGVLLPRGPRWRRRRRLLYVGGTRSHVPVARSVAGVAVPVHP